MYSYARKLICLILIVTLMLLLPQRVSAGDHVVSQLDLQKATESASQIRQQNIQKVERFVANEHVQQTIRTLKFDPVKITKAIPLLNDEELSKIAAQTDVVQANFAAGYSERELVYLLIVVLLVIAIVVVVASAVD